jgi:hypothetical protein
MRFSADNPLSFFPSLTGDSGLCIHARRCIRDILSLRGIKGVRGIINSIGCREVRS